MNIKNKKELEWSSIVANNSMNRERKAIGINSYEKDVYLNPVTFIKSRLTKNSINSTVNWIDLCCGQGNALIEVAKLFLKENLEKQLTLEGIDLVDFFSEHQPYQNLLELKSMNLEDWQPDKEYDLITIVHGLHYVGDKLGLIKKSLECLKKDGTFIANLDMNNIKIMDKANPLDFLKHYFKQEHLHYNARRKIIKIEGKRSLNIPFNYLGGNDEAGPNYSGQDSVDSIYELVA